MSEYLSDSAAFYSQLPSTPKKTVNFKIILTFFLKHLRICFFFCNFAAVWGYCIFFNEQILPKKTQN